MQPHLLPSHTCASSFPRNIILHTSTSMKMGQCEGKWKHFDNVGLSCLVCSLAGCCTHIDFMVTRVELDCNTSRKEWERKTTFAAIFAEHYNYLFTLGSNNQLEWVCTWQWPNCRSNFAFLPIYNMTKWAWFNNLVKSCDNLHFFLNNICVCLNT